MSKSMTRRELRMLRREWRRTVARAGRLTRNDCPILAGKQYARADDLERRIRSLSDELEATR